MKLTWIMALLLVPMIAFSADPVALIKAKDTELQQLLKKKSQDSKETETIKKLVNGIFDFTVMARKSLPAKVWKDLKPEQQNEFTTVFQRMVENSSVKKLEMYKSDSTRYEASEIKGNTAKVTANVYNKGRSSVLVYKLDLQGNEWRAWDLVIDDVSTSANYRDQFSKILEKKTFAELIEVLRKKADEGK